MLFIQLHTGVSLGFLRGIQFSLEKPSSQVTLLVIQNVHKKILLDFIILLDF